MLGNSEKANISNIEALMLDEEFIENGFHLSSIPIPFPPKIPPIESSSTSTVGITPTGKHQVYCKVSSVLTDAEKTFNRKLLEYLGKVPKLNLLSKVTVTYKVRLADLVCMANEEELSVSDKRHRLSKIAARHIDFVLLDSETYAPIVAIELNDDTHLAQHRVSRDKEVLSILTDAKLPLVFINTKIYNISDNDFVDIMSILNMYFKFTCLECGGQLRMCNNSQYQKHFFFGCSNYRDSGCKFTINVTDI